MADERKTTLLATRLGRGRMQKENIDTIGGNGGGPGGVRITGCHQNPAARLGGAHELIKIYNIRLAYAHAFVYIHINLPKFVPEIQSVKRVEHEHRKKKRNARKLEQESTGLTRRPRPGMGVDDADAERSCWRGSCSRKPNQRLF